MLEQRCRQCSTSCGEQEQCSARAFSGCRQCLCVQGACRACAGDAAASGARSESRHMPAALTACERPLPHLVYPQHAARPAFKRLSPCVSQGACQVLRYTNVYAAMLSLQCQRLFDRYATSCLINTLRRMQVRQLFVVELWYFVKKVAMHLLIRSTFLEPFTAGLSSLPALQPACNILCRQG